MVPHSGRWADWMKMVALLVCQAVLLPCAALLAADGPALLPQPVRMRIEAGHFTTTPATNVVDSKGDKRLADAARYYPGGGDWTCLESEEVGWIDRDGPLEIANRQFTAAEVRRGLKSAIEVCAKHDWQERHYLCVGLRPPLEE